MNLITANAKEGQVLPQSNIAGKPVLTVSTRIVNPASDFAEKGLCNGPTFSAGSACVYTCRYCYVEPIMNRGGSAVWETLHKAKLAFQDVVIRRENPLQHLRAELRNNRGKLRYKYDERTVYASPVVDVAATIELARETTDLCLEILGSTGWSIRLLSKSPFLLRIASALPAQWRHRIIFGLSTGTFDKEVAKAIEPDAPSPTKRLQALEELQKEGFRTFAMLCPILPQDPEAFVKQATQRINLDACEHVWAEVLNRRGASMQRTHQALNGANLTSWAQQLRGVFGKDSTSAWEAYARGIFRALADVVPAGKLRFLQYVTPRSRHWWENEKSHGAILLGKNATPVTVKKTADLQQKAKRRAAALKAWETIRKNRQMAAAGSPNSPMAKRK